MTALLEGVRVLDLTRILAGPWATQNLADMGAEVIKIERPGHGDDSRTFGPPFLKDTQTGDPTDAAYYLTCNRGKKSVAVDISTPEGQQIVLELAAKSDILVENYKVGGLKKYGLDYESLKERFPHLVYCSITGFGQTGPYAPRAGYDYLIQGMGGLMSVTGEPDDQPGGGPQRVGVAVIDLFTGMYATVAILAALRNKDKTGKGQHIDIGMLDVSASMMVNQAMNYFVTGKVPQRTGKAHPNIAPYQWFHASDGHILLAVGNSAQYERMCKVMGRPDLATNEKFATPAARVANAKELAEIIDSITRQKTIDEWVSLMESVDVPCGPINTLDRLFSDPQIEARGTKTRYSHPVYGEVTAVNNPIRFSDTPISDVPPPPVLGEHTAAVLTSVLGKSPEELEALKAKGTVGLAEYPQLSQTRG